MYPKRYEEATVLYPKTFRLSSPKRFGCLLERLVAVLVLRDSLLDQGRKTAAPATGIGSRGCRITWLDAYGDASVSVPSAFFSITSRLKSMGWYSTFCHMEMKSSRCGWNRWPLWPVV